jgi:adenosine deaminase CECR1
MIRRKSHVLCLLFMVSYQLANCRSLQKTQIKNDLGALPEELDAKLEQTYAEFKAANEYLMTRVVTEGGLVDRADWEEHLPTYQSFTEADKALLESHLRDLAEQSKNANEKKSALALEAIRSDDKELERFCTAMPKGGMLHVHPWGTVDQPTLKGILAQVNPKFDLKTLLANLETGGAFGQLYPAETEFLLALQSKYQKSSGDYKCNVKSPPPASDEDCPTYSVLSDDEKSQIERLYFLPKENQQGVPRFDRFLGSFTVFSATVFQTRKGVDPEKIMYNAFFQRAKDLGVSYVEITQFLGRDQAEKKWLPSLQEWSKEIESQYGVTPKLLAAFTRAKSPDDIRKSALQMADRLQSDLPEATFTTPDQILVGVNLLADETTNPALEKGQTLYPFVANFRQSRPLGMTMHAGELGDVRNVRDAVIMGVERVGHGVLLRNDVVTLELARRHYLSLGIETNIISNLLLDVAPDVGSHPFLDFLRLGFAVSLSTDDEGIFESTIVDECVAAVKHTNINYCELQKTASNSIQSSFASGSEKARLMERLKADFGAFESNWAHLKIENATAESCL